MEEQESEADNSTSKTVGCALERHIENLDSDQATTDLEVAKDEWEEVASVEPTVASDEPKALPSESLPVTFSQAWEYYKERDMSKFLSQGVMVEDAKQAQWWFCSCVSKQHALRSELVHERDLIVAISHEPYDNADSMHWRMLSTIYKQLKSGAEPARYGAHWEDIGFQGSDPATDLRGVGMLGVVQALYLCVSPRSVALARDILRLADSPTQCFPMQVLSINITRIALQALKDGLLNQLCNSRGAVCSVVNEFYAAVFCHIFCIWKSQNKTIKDGGYVLKDAEKFARQKVRRIIAEFYKQLQNYPVEEEKKEDEYFI